MKKFIILLLMIGGGIISAQEKFTGDILRVVSVSSISDDANRVVNPNKFKHFPGHFGHRVKRIDKAKFSSGLHVHPNKFRY